MKVKTRFAPSPTGYLHIGSVRTALYSWLFARNHNGKFVLRIEDTDLERSTPEAVKDIIDSMNWLDLKWDEGPFFQTERINRYNAVINDMLSSGTAYKCYCSKKHLDTIRKEQILRGKKPRYNGRCRYDRTRHSDNELYVVRFANPQEGYVVFYDQVRGPIKFYNQELDDLVIRRTDGSPTYNFCVVVDDLDMAITHIIRGEDHINNTPRQINIFKALNASIPIYAHIPMINGEDGKKLSKRHGAMSVMQFRNNGYLPEALINYLVRLGWSKGNQEIFSRREMIKFFSLKSINKSAGIFDINKLQWLNQYYINTLPAEYVALHLKWHIKQANLNIDNNLKIAELINLLGKRCKTLKEIIEKHRYFYEDFDEFNIDAAKKYLCLVSRQTLEIVRNKLITIDKWTMENIRYLIQDTANELKLEKSKINMPLRVAINGTDKSPTLDAVIYIIGKSRCIKRINRALDFISQYKICNK